LKPSSRAKINEAMSGNTADSPSASDTESNNPYDVLRDDDDEVTTDIDQKESDEDEDAMSTQNSARFSPSESDYESAHDTMSLVGQTMKLQRKMEFSDDGLQTNQGKLHPLVITATRAENQEKNASSSPSILKSSDDLAWVLGFLLRYGSGFTCGTGWLIVGPPEVKINVESC
jgi:hypothetical protein